MCIYTFPDAVSSNPAAPNLCSLEMVQSGLNFSKQSFGGMQQSVKYLSQYFIESRCAYWLHRDSCYTSRSLRLVSHFLVCHDHAPNIFSVAPRISHIPFCRISFPRIDVLYGIWISFSVFDYSKSFELRQLPGFDTSDCQPS